MKGRQISRLVCLLSVVMAGRRLATERQLAAVHQCHWRTIRRDLDAIKAAGWSVRGGARRAEAA